MKILHVVQSLDPAWGGIARVLPALAMELARAGDECRVATLAGGRFGDPPRYEGIEVWRFAPTGGSRLGRSADFNRRIDEMVQWADVVHLHGLWTGQNWAAGKAARKAGRPYVMTPHSMMMPWAWRRSWWKKRPIGWLFEHENLRRAACLHALAEGEAKAMRMLGFNQQIEEIPNGLHPEEYEKLPAPDRLTSRFPELAGRKWLVILGRIHPQKGIVQGMQACFDVFAAASDWHLIVAGPDEIGIQSMLQAAVARKGLNQRVTFTGALNREEVLACLGNAKLLLQPSMSEGLSMSILESLAAGVPVLISDACNMPEVEAFGAGRIVASTRREIATALRSLVTKSTDEIAAMGQKGRQLVRERFDWKVLIPRYREMYARTSRPARQ
ncbi:MAG TPA: glycosyltransferase [Phycisphaerae bacterium]|nr:glycosyltransferase [Phycisphaerae bacterium]